MSIRIVDFTFLFLSAYTYNRISLIPQKPMSTQEHGRRSECDPSFIKWSTKWLLGHSVVEHVVKKVEGFIEKKNANDEN